LTPTVTCWMVGLSNMVLVSAPICSIFTLSSASGSACLGEYALVSRLGALPSFSGAAPNGFCALP